ncbi:hypothetical protein DFZ51_21730 [Escherichia coli]|uniref:Uncharacterized protein n=1 Tax=Escherichia coli TaxID=562 RepID=A0A776LPB9_ECOLX|nr:hypothetical protein [Escherichia coli]
MRWTKPGLELDSFPIKLGFEEVGFNPLLHLKLLFPSFSLFILCNVSRRVASLDTAPGVEHLAKSFGRRFRDGGTSSSFKGTCYEVEPGNYSPIRVTLPKPITTYRRL